MPFQSEKQRRYMHANLPEIAKRWERDYANGGILDIDTNEEIISDDGNDIELTAYNAAFDDPNDLSTGVKTLFQAKDGGNIRLQPHKATDLLAKKNPDGTRSKYQPPGYREATKVERTAASEDIGFDQPSAPETKAPATISTPTGGDQEDDTAEMMRKMALQDIIERGPGSDVEKYDTWEQMIQDKYPGQGLTYEQPFFNIQKSKVILGKARNQWEQVRDSTNKKLKNMVGKKIISGLLMRGVTFGLSDIIGVMIQGFKQNKAKKEFITAINNQIKNYRGLGFAEHNPHVDTLIQTLNQEILDLTQRPDEDEGRESPEPIYAPVTGAVGEEYAQGYYGMSDLERIRAGQAARAAAVPDWQLTAEEAAAQELNRGGLANLFRVKNQ